LDPRVVFTQVSTAAVPPSRSLLLPAYSVSVLRFILWPVFVVTSLAYFYFHSFASAAVVVFVVAHCLFLSPLCYEQKTQDNSKKLEGGKGFKCLLRSPNHLRDFGIILKNEYIIIY